MNLEQFLQKAKKDKINELEADINAVNDIFYSHFQEYKSIIVNLPIKEQKCAMRKLLCIFKINNVDCIKLLDEVEDKCLTEDDWSKIEKSIDQRLNERKK